MTVTSSLNDEAWPALSYSDFAPIQHLLHMGLQAIGKLKLSLPFEPQWAHIPLWLTSRGLTTGPLPYRTGAYTVDVDLNEHQVSCATNWGTSGQFAIRPMSVAQFVSQLFSMLREAGVEAQINMKPQEVANTTPFDHDTELRPYDGTPVQRWWRILLSTERVMHVFHARFEGKTQPIGLMWGTLDIRDVRYNGKPAPVGPKEGYIRRNAMNAELVEVGWWSGSQAYPKPAFYSFTYPQPSGIETASVQPAAGRWDPTMGEFLLDYDELRKSKNPDVDLLAFFESTYAAGATSAGWDAKLIGSGHPE